MPSRYRFRNSGEAANQIDLMEQMRDDEVGALRDQGKHAQADQLADRWNRDLAEARGEHRRLKEKEAGSTRQPRHVPQKAERKAPLRAPQRRHSSLVAGARYSQRGLSGPARTGYRRSGAQQAVSSWTSLGWQIVGTTLGLAALTLFLAGDNGPAAFTGILGGLTRGLALIVDPIDPLAKGAVATTLEGQAAPTAPTPGKVVV